MSSTETRPRTPAELRKFGFTMAGAFAVLAGIAWWRHAGTLPWFAGIALAFFVLGGIAPRALRPVEYGWMRMAAVLGTIMTHLLLTLMFYVVITPIGLLKRLFSGDSLGRQPDPRQETYWVPVRADGSANRPDKPF